MRHKHQYAVFCAFAGVLSASAAGCITGKQHDARFAAVEIRDVEYEILSRQFEVGPEIENKVVSGTKTVSGITFLPIPHAYWWQIARNGSVYDQAKQEAVIHAGADGLLETLVQSSEENILWFHIARTVTVYGKPIKFKPLGPVSDERKAALERRFREELEKRQQREKTRSILGCLHSP